MTPDTALAIYRDCCEDEDGDWQLEAMRRIILAAQNDTLERAAIAAAEAWLTPGVTSRAAVSDAIRALKHT